MPAVNYTGSGGPPRPRGYRSLPLWLQWALPFSVAGALVVALVLFVQHQTNDVPAVAAVNSPKAVAEQNREDRILVRDQQAPHTVRLKPGAAAAPALRAAVVGYMNHQINVGSMAGPIRHASCRPAVGGTSARLVFHCQVTASAQMVTYPFDAVVRPAAGLITYCQRVAPPVPSMNVPVSRRCS